MTADLTREQALKQMALAIYCAYRSDYTPGDAAHAWEDLNESPLRDDIEHDAAAALTVLWPVVEGLRADLAHAHTVIARHVEPLRKPCRPEAGDCCDGSAHTWQPAQGSRLPDREGGNTPSDALYGDLSHQTPGSGVSGRDGKDGGA